MVSFPHRLKEIPLIKPEVNVLFVVPFMKFTLSENNFTSITEPLCAMRNVVRSDDGQYYTHYDIKNGNVEFVHPSALSCDVLDNSQSQLSLTLQNNPISCFPYPAGFSPFQLINLVDTKVTAFPCAAKDKDFANFDLLKVLSIGPSIQTRTNTTAFPYCCNLLKLDESGIALSYMPMYLNRLIHEQDQGAPTKCQYWDGERKRTSIIHFTDFKGNSELREHCGGEGNLECPEACSGLDVADPSYTFGVFLSVLVPFICVYLAIVSVMCMQERMQRSEWVKYDNSLAIFLKNVWVFWEVESKGAYQGAYSIPYSEETPNGKGGGMTSAHSHAYDTGDASHVPAYLNDSQYLGYVNPQTSYVAKNNESQSTSQNVYEIGLIPSRSSPYSDEKSLYTVVVKSNSIGKHK